MRRVITYGTFDLFHEGHYKLLERAKKLGDYLIVGVTTETYDSSRGKLNVVDSIVTRIDNVRKSGFADEIIIEDHEGQKIEDIQKYQVDIFAIGSDWTGKFDYLKKYCEVIYLERTKGVSSTEKRADSFGVIHLGMMGTGRIARRHIPESKYVSRLDINAVFNPHLKSAKSFSDELEIGYYTDDEESFYEQVDAVCIATPHDTHYSYAKNALLHGKHVLCEKPLCLRRAEAEALYQLADDKHLVLMEAIKTAHAPGFTRLMNLVETGIIGDIKDVEACFTRLTPDNSREMTDTITGGSFTEFGSYTLLPIIKLLGTDFKDIRFDSITAPNGLDVYTKVHFKYLDSYATSKTGLKVKSDGHLLISGTKGYIFVPAPWWLTKEFEVCYEDFTKNERFTSKFLGDGLRYEQNDFLNMISNIDRSNYKLSLEESIAMAGIMERFLLSQRRL